MEAVLEATPQQTFPKKHRLSNGRQFGTVRRTGLRQVGRWLCIDYRKGMAGPGRLGVTVSKKYGNAVQRNRFKRHVREVFRQFPGQASLGGIWLNVRPRSAAHQASFQELCDEFSSLIQQILAL